MQARPASDAEGTEQPQRPKKKPKVASVSAVHGLAERTQVGERSNLAKGSISHKEQHAANVSASDQAQNAAAVLGAGRVDNQARSSNKGAQNGSKVSCVHADISLIDDSVCSIALVQENR